MTLLVDRRSRYRGGQEVRIGPSFARVWVGVVEGAAAATGVVGMRSRYGYRLHWQPLSVLIGVWRWLCA